MTDNKIYLLITAAAAVADRNAFVSEWATSSIWDDDPEANIPNTRIIQLCHIWDLAHLSVAQIRKHLGLSQAAFGVRFLIPKRTIENWEGGQNECPIYTRMLLARVCGLFDPLTHLD